MEQEYATGTVCINPATHWKTGGFDLDRQYVLPGTYYTRLHFEVYQVLFSIIWYTPFSGVWRLVVTGSCEHSHNTCSINSCVFHLELNWKVSFSISDNGSNSPLLSLYNTIFIGDFNISFHISPLDKENSLLLLIITYVSVRSIVTLYSCTELLYWYDTRTKAIYLLGVCINAGLDWTGLEYRSWRYVKKWPL